MCGRYSLATDIEGLAGRFDFKAIDLTFRQRYNIAPTQHVLSVTNDGSENQAHEMKWGLIPFWAKDKSIGNRMINARAETLAWKPAFRQAYQKRRCLVIADGFYEWRKVGKGKVPMRIVLESGEPFAFAGLWENWKSPEDEWVKSCTIITTTPNDTMEPIHNRMPVILSRDAESLWLNPKAEQGTLGELLVPYEAGAMEAYEVSTLVNSPKNEIPEIIARAAG